MVTLGWWLQSYWEDTGRAVEASGNVGTEGIEQCPLKMGVTDGKVVGRVKFPKAERSLDPPFQSRGAKQGNDYRTLHHCSEEHADGGRDSHC